MLGVFLVHVIYFAFLIISSFVLASFAFCVFLCPAMHPVCFWFGGLCMLCCSSLVSCLGIAIYKKHIYIYTYIIFTGLSMDSIRFVLMDQPNSSDTLCATRYS